MSIREKLIQLCEQLGMEEEDIDKLRDAPEVKIINQILYFSLEDEALFSSDITYADIESVLDSQYNESTLDEHYCFMFYESTIGGVHTYTDITEMKERFLEAYNWVKGLEENIKIVMGTFEKGCGVTVLDKNNKKIYHKLVFENEKGCYIEVNNKFYYKEDVEMNN